MHFLSGSELPIPARDLPGWKGTDHGEPRTKRERINLYLGNRLRLPLKLKSPAVRWRIGAVWQVPAIILAVSKHTLKWLIDSCLGHLLFPPPKESGAGIGNTGRGGHQNGIAGYLADSHTPSLHYMYLKDRGIQSGIG